MLVSRKGYDAGAAFCCGVGAAYIAFGLRPIPGVVSYLGWLGFGWVALMIVGCFGAGLGALLRNRGQDARSFRRRVWSINLERVCWPAVAFSAFVFAIGVLIAVGPVAGMTSLGWSGFVISTCAGHWWVIRRARKGPPQ